MNEMHNIYISNKLNLDFHKRVFSTVYILLIIMIVICKHIIRLQLL